MVAMLKESKEKALVAYDEPPGTIRYPVVSLNTTPRPAKWADVPDSEWNSWRWQLSHRLNSLEELSSIINLTPDEIEGISARDRFRLDITPYFASLIDPDDPNCPIRQQIIPTGRELEGFESMMEDSLAEDAHSPVPGLIIPINPPTEF